MSRTRIVVVGAGFAGYRTARTLSRLTRHTADITLLNPTDYFLHLPLLPHVATGVLEPRRVTVSLSGTLPHVRLALGEADGVDLERRTVTCTDAVLPRQAAQLGLVRSWSVPLESASPEPARLPRPDDRPARATTHPPPEEAPDARQP
ncbi:MULTISPECIES: FAD-dependent oxidoreductase [Streptomyces]|uniref:FAD-dependent oxidoreductase n=1 Tax=unclassified Streptomyces TaxID=2593676 RepID=UPI0021E016CE|nr:FAD-dependent oxidoreductase [Streptomyces venezuelae]